MTVRPGSGVEAADPHPRRPAPGVVHFLVEADNQSGTPVCRMRTRLLFARRAPGGGDRK
ncbi:hypothetical protein ACIBCA_14620 [Kitasatospora sp. NPDC051170]|uniref:hypothetical protein n=1 Tax=Kitasatospora sp. NPDC051170 TaxID=3364056 RepID=UPI0037A98EA6